MGQHNFIVNVINTPLGTPQSNDGIFMMFIMAVAASNFTLDQKYLIGGLTDLYALLGVSDAAGAEAFDKTNGIAIYQQVKEFYDAAGSGTLLWIVGVDKSATSNQFANSGTPYIGGTVHNQLIKDTALLDPLQKAKMVGYCYAPPATGQSSTDFNTDVPLALVAAQAARTSLFTEGYQYNFIVDGANMSDIKSPSQLGSEATNSIYNGSLCITGTKPNGISAVGLCLGRFSRISVGTALNLVQDGATPATDARLTNFFILDSATGTIVTGNTYLVAGTNDITYNGITYSPGDYFTGITGVTTFIGGIVPTLALTVTTPTGPATDEEGKIVAGGFDPNNEYEIIFNTESLGSIKAATLADLLTAIVASYTAYCIAHPASDWATRITSFVTTGTEIDYVASTFADAVSADFVLNKVNNSGLLHYATEIKNLAEYPDFNSLGAKQYLFLRYWSGHAGYYWNDAATCCDTTLPLSGQEFGRVANKLSDDLRVFFIGNIGQKYPINTKTGTVDTTCTNSLAKQFETTYVDPIKTGSGTGDITDARLTMTGTPSGNQITWQFTLQIVGMPMVGGAVGTVSFTYTI